MSRFLAGFVLFCVFMPGVSQAQSTMYLSYVQSDLIELNRAGEIRNDKILKLADHYEQSMAIDKQPPLQPDLVNARKLLDTLLPKALETGLVTCYRTGDPTLIYNAWGRWQNMRENLDKVMGNVHRSVERGQEQGNPAMAMGTIKWAQEELKKQVKASNAGKATPDLEKHPAFLRATEYILEAKVWSTTAAGTAPPPKLAPPTKRVEYGAVAKLQPPTPHEEYGKVSRVEPPKHENPAVTGTGPAPTQRVEYGTVAKLEPPTHGETNDKVSRIEPPKHENPAMAGVSPAPVQPVKDGTSDAAPHPATTDTPLKQGRSSMNKSKVFNALLNLKRGKTKEGAEVYMELLDGYEGAIIDGWDEKTPELLEARQVMASIYPKVKEDLTTCYSPMDPSLVFDGAPVNIRQAMDETVAECDRATERLHRFPKGKYAREALETIGRQEAGLEARINECEAAKAPVDVRKTKTYHCYLERMTMVKALPENIVKESDIAGKAAENALKQCWAIYYTFRPQENKPNLLPDDMRELFSLAIRNAEGQDMDYLLRGEAMETLVTYLSKTEDLKTRVVPSLQEAVVAYEKVFGKSKEEFEQKSQPIMAAIDNPVYRDEISGSFEYYEKLKGGIASAEKVRMGLIQAVYADSQEKYGKARENVRQHAQDWSREVKERAFAEIIPNLEILLKVDPENEKARALLGNVKQQMGDVKLAEQRAIDAATFPTRHLEDFAGPGTTQELSESALKWLRREWNQGEHGQEAVAVIVRGNWYSYKRNILGQTIQWGLPVVVAFKRNWGEWQAKDDYAVVIYMSMLTPESVGVEKKPNWTMTGVGDLYKMRLSKVKQIN